MISPSDRDVQEAAQGHLKMSLPASSTRLWRRIKSSTLPPAGQESREIRFFLATRFVRTMHSKQFTQNP